MFVKFEHDAIFRKVELEPFLVEFRQRNQGLGLVIHCFIEDFFYMPGDTYIKKSCGYGQHHDHAVDDCEI